MTIARASDLSLPEFVAFNHLRNHSAMRRWELPFALFQARLDSVMAVLDCTINPEGFQEPLLSLFPHVLYRHWNPVHDGIFHLPVGVPDDSFDRVICVNTLEHLLEPQREALIGDLSRKLKAGGLLVATCDYYFDGFWGRTELLRMGVMRPDRREIFNGWNKVTPRELTAICASHELLPLNGDLEEPDEHDSTLYRNVEPYPHTTIGGVFCKGHPPILPPGRKVVLGLLTWNTKHISLESLRAHVQEASMLRRLGHEPFIAVCDNGSTDGTAEALRALEGQIGFPHRFIFNDRNHGNSVARNQLIDLMLQVDADYLLFMDGDIELVPSSTVAMLRYMENNGCRLGCVGPHSSGQSPHRKCASVCLYSIHPSVVRTTNLVAWTQYGLFRREVFCAGVRFDAGHPFDGAGWGFEDNDLAFQMEMKGFVNQYFTGMTYLHRDVRSSIRIMRARGINAERLYLRRKQYVIDKWASVPQINEGPLADVRRVEMRF